MKGGVLERVFSIQLFTWFVFFPIIQWVHLPGHYQLLKTELCCVALSAVLESSGPYWQVQISYSVKMTKRHSLYP